MSTRIQLTACAALLVLTAWAGPVRALQPDSEPPASSSGVGSLADRLDNLIIESQAMETLSMGLHVVDLDSGDVMYDKRGGRLMVPASNMKLYSSAAALDLLGPDHRWRTEIYFAGAISGGVLEGDVILTGNGDPALRSETVIELVREWATGNEVSRIDGNIIINPHRFRYAPKGPGWAWDDDPAAYNMSVDGLTMDYNVLTVRIQPGGAVGEPAVVTFDPPSDYPELRATVTTSHAEDSSARTRATRESFRDVVEVTGGIPLGSDPRSVRLTMHDPARWIGGVVAGALESQGVQVSGEIMVVRDEMRYPTANSRIFRRESLPLSEIISLFNKTSENIIGEMLIHTLASSSATTGGAVGYTESIRATGAWLTETVGLPERSFRVADGSGLSRYNLISARGTTALLAHMWNHPHRDVYTASLPIAGRDGTLSSRMRDTAAQDRVLAKTGTMSGVSCLSGYIHTASGRNLAFAVLTNGFVGSSVPTRELQDAICVILAEF